MALWKKSFCNFRCCEHDDTIIYKFLCMPLSVLTLYPPPCSHITLS